MATFTSTELSHTVYNYCIFITFKFLCCYYCCVNGFICTFLYDVNIKL